MAIEGKLNRDTGGFLLQNTCSISNKLIIFVIISFAKYDHFDQAFWLPAGTTTREFPHHQSQLSQFTFNIPQQRIGEEFVAIHKRVPWQIS